MKLTDVIRRPLITEKTSILREDGRTLVFQVATDANKIEIKRAVEQLLGVEGRRASAPRIAHGKMKRQGRFVGPPLGLEEGVREAARRREDAGIPGRRVRRSCRFANTTRRRPAARFQTVQTFDEITTSEPYKPLIEPLHSSGGRNNRGELTSWWRGGGHKRMYRIIDFKRDKRDIPAKVSTIEYDPNRSARIALLTYADGEKRYILQPVGLKVGDTIVAGRERRHPAGQLPAAEEHPARHA